MGSQSKTKLQDRPDRTKLLNDFETAIKKN